MSRLALHPGEHLAEELEALDMSAAALGRALKVPTNRTPRVSSADKDCRTPATASSSIWFKELNGRVP